MERDGGFLYDDYGRRILRTAIAETPPAITDIRMGGALTDAEGRELVVLEGHDGGDVGTQLLDDPDWSRTTFAHGDLHEGTITAFKRQKLIAHIEAMVAAGRIPVWQDFLGDLTESALPAEETLALATLAAVSQAIPTTVTIGNHDRFNLRTIAQFAATYAAYLGDRSEITVGTAGKNYIVDLPFVRKIHLGEDENTNPHVLSDATVAYMVARAAETTKDCWVYCHFPLPQTVGEVRADPTADQQFSTYIDHGPVSLARARVFCDALRSVPNVKMIVCGHTHSSMNATGLIKQYELAAFTPTDVVNVPNLLAKTGTQFTDAQIMASGQLLSSALAGFESGVAGWANTAVNVTADPLAASTAWAEQGSQSMKFKYVATAANAQGAPTFSPAQTLPATAVPGARLGVRAVVNVLSKPANGQRLFCQFQTAAGAFISTVSGTNWATGLGRNILLLSAVIPANAGRYILFVGNTSGSAWWMQNGETSEGYVDDIRVTVPTVEPAPDLSGVNFESPQTTWAVSKSAATTQNNFELSTAWAHSGLQSLRLRATASAAGGESASLYSVLFAVAPGRNLAVVIPYNIAVKPANGQRVYVEWYNAAGAVIGVGNNATYLDWAESAGVGYFSGVVRVPDVARQARVWVGNFNLGARSLGPIEVTDFSMDDPMFCYVDGMSPSNSRKLWHVNTGALVGVGYGNAPDEPVVSLALTHAYDAIEVRAYDHVTQGRRPIQGQLTFRLPITP